MAGMNQQLNDDIETVFLMADVSLQPIASKLVKEIARFGGRDRQVRDARRRRRRSAALERRFTLSVSGATACGGTEVWGGICSLRLLFVLPLAALLIAAAPAPVAPAPSIVAPPEVAANPANHLFLDLSNGGTVEIVLRPDLAPHHIEQIQTLVRRGFYNGLTFHRVDPRLHGAGRRSQGHRRRRVRSSRPQGRVHRRSVPPRHVRRGARGHSGQRQQPVLHHVRAQSRAWTTITPSSAGW